MLNILLRRISFLLAAASQAGVAQLSDYLPAELFFVPNHAFGVDGIHRRWHGIRPDGAVWNHGVAVDGINPKEEKSEYALMRDAMPSQSDGFHTTGDAC